jgi:hypothetical protein
MRRSFLALIPQLLFVCSLAWAQEQKPPDDMPGMNMPAAVSSPAPKPDASASTTPTPDATEPITPAPQTQPEVRTPAISLSDSDMRDMAGTNADGTAHAMRSMEDRQMSMGPHMTMTTLRDLKPGDQEKADQVVAAARRAAEKYTDYKVALSDGYRIFLPKLPQRQYHFTNYRYAFESAIGFDPEHPTSLLYEKHGDDYKLIGVMYTAPKNASWSELDQRIPLSIAQWHAHVNMCIPPADRRNEAWGAKAKFGLVGSITTKADCDAAGGKFMPQIFGWMVHVYPFEQKPENIWSVERQAHVD